MMQRVYHKNWQVTTLVCHMRPTVKYYNYITHLKPSDIDTKGRPWATLINIIINGANTC